MKLTVHGWSKRHLLTLVQEDGVTRIEGLGPLQETAEGWIAHGLLEYIGEEGAQQRVTPSSSPDFLPRVKACIDREYDLLEAVLFP
jgi:hypothetical protein